MTTPPVPGTDEPAVDALWRIYLDHLSDEGYRPEVDEDGDIHFKHERRHYYITRNSNEDFLQVLFPQFWPIESPEELQAAYRATGVVNATCKVAKLWVRDREDDMNASAELFVASPHVAMLHLPRCLDVLQLATSMFRDEMHARLG